MTKHESFGWPIWIGVVVENLRQQSQFWSHLLTQPGTAVGSEYVQFGMGEGRVFELLQRSDLPQRDRVRFQLGFAVDDIQRAYDDLRELGAQPVTEIMAGGESPWAAFRDPEGNIFEITRR